jgi:hypothetical protein
LSSPPSLTVNPREPQAFDRAWRQEEIGLGRKVRALTVEARNVRGRQWIPEGTTIGYKQLPCFKEFSASRARLAVLADCRPHGICGVLLYSITAIPCAGFCRL